MKKQEITIKNENETFILLDDVLDKLEELGVDTSRLTIVERYVE